MYIFISHSSTDAIKAQEVCKTLEENGMQCFIAPRNIRAGKIYAEEIVEGINQSDAFVLLLSKAADESPHVLRELERACSKKIPVFVYKLEEFPLSKATEYFIMSHQWVNNKNDSDYSVILTRIKEYFHDSEEEKVLLGAASTAPQLTEKSKAEHSWLPFACAAGVVVCLGIGGMLYSRNSNQPGDPVQIDVDVNSESNSGKKNKPTTTTDAASAEPTKEASADPTKEAPAEPTQVVTAKPTQTIAENPLNLKVGDTMQFGWYQGEPISWRVIRQLDDGNLVVLSEHILMMKCFDTAESGKYNYSEEGTYWKDLELDYEMEKQIRGNNNWYESNIRTWLNSTDEVVNYTDTPPTKKSMPEQKNDYFDEPGFLNGFYPIEREALVPYQTKTVNYLGEETTGTDLVFLLSEEELGWLAEAGLSMLATPTQTAITNDGTNGYYAFSTSMGYEAYYWMLRDAELGTACKVKTVSNYRTEEMLLSVFCGAESFGVRPAICIDPSKIMTN